MKTALMVTAAALAVGGCSDDCMADHATVQKLGLGLRVCTVRGHDYIMYVGYHSAAMLHAASCPCLDLTNQQKPPQNWGRFAATYRDAPKEQGEAHD